MSAERGPAEPAPTEPAPTESAPTESAPSARALVPAPSRPARHDRSRHAPSRRGTARSRAPLLAAALLALVACESGGGAGDDPDGGAGGEPPLPRAGVLGLAATHPYRRDSPYAAVLARCALIEATRDACPLDTLPFIAQETSEPGIDDVMARVLVTHDWMGERLERLLRSRPNELLPLFGPITSIVVGSTVRPSFYWSVTGGIQLDPAGLWLNVAEKRNVAATEDYRTPFRRLLDFRNLQSLRIAGEPAYAYFDLEDRSERGFDDIVVPTMSLLFHELAHASDALPPGTAASLDASLRPSEALDGIAEPHPSTSLDSRQPLASTLLRELARVRFRGEEPSAEQRTVSATVAGAEMAYDGATDFYSYHTIREDFANLFEALMMKRLYDVDIAIAFTGQPADPDDVRCADLLVAWGVRKRLGEPSVAARARIAYESIYGADPTLDGFLAAQEGTEEPMTAGVDWCTNRDGEDALLARSRRAHERLPPEPPSHAERHAIVEGMYR